MPKRFATVAGISVILLGACASPKKEYVYVACPPPVVPEPEYPKVKPEDGIFVRVQALLVERELRKAYEAELRAALGKCAAPLE